MNANANKELLLVILSARHSRMHTTSLNAGRLAAVLVGIAVVLLLAGHRPASAGGTSSYLPDATGLSISIPPNGTTHVERQPQLQVTSQLVV